MTAEYCRKRVCLPHVDDALSLSKGYVDASHSTSMAACMRILSANICTPMCLRACLCSLTPPPGFRRNNSNPPCQQSVRRKQFSVSQKCFERVCVVYRGISTTVSMYGYESECALLEMYSMYGDEMVMCTPMLQLYSSRSQ